jgi:hypothetical protein
MKKNSKRYEVLFHPLVWRLYPFKGFTYKLSYCHEKLISIHYHFLFIEFKISKL